MDNPLQNQQQHEEDIVDPPPYLDGNSTAALWQQQLLQNMPELSNIQGFLRTPAQLPISQTNTGISQRNSQELESEELNWEELIRSPSPAHSTLWGTTNFTQSPTYSPLWGPTNFTPSPTYSPLRGPTNFTPSPTYSLLWGPTNGVGVRITINLDDILQTKGMCLRDAAEHLKVARSTFKRACREYQIHRWPPRKEHWLISQSRPNESPAIVDQEQIPQSNSDTLLPSNHVSATIDTNSVKETSPIARQENPGEEFGDDEVEAVGMGGEGTGEEGEMAEGQLNSGCLGKGKRKLKNSGGERRNKKIAGVQIAIPLEDILQTGGMLLKDAAEHLKVTSTELMSSCREYGIQRWPPCNEHKLIVQSLLNETLAVVDQEAIPQLTSHYVPFDQALMATIDSNSVVEREIPLKQFWPTAQQENLDAGSSNNGAEAIGIWGEGTGECVMEEAQLNSKCSGKKGKRKVNTPGGERGNNRTIGVRVAISKEDILWTKGMTLKDAAKHLKVSIPVLKSSCREYGIRRWPPHNEHKLIRQSLLNETLAVVDQEVIPQLTSYNVPSDQALMATVDTNSVVEKEILLTQFLPTAQQENLDAGFGNDEAEAIGMGGEETGEGVIEEAQLNFGCSKKQGKRKVNTPGGERGNNRTTGVRIAIPKEDILRTRGMRLKDVANHLGAEAVGMGSGGTGQTDIEEVQLNSRYLGKEKRKEMTPGGERRNKKDAISLEDILRYKEMPQKDAAKHLNVGVSTLKRACRGHGIPSWPPCGEHNQSQPNESSAVVDKEPIPQLNSDTVLPSNQDSATIDTKRVTMKARYGTVTIKFQLSWPWGMVELKQEVKKRLELEAGTYYVNYKDEDNDDILIACDEDLQDHISRSSLPGTNWIEVFLQPK